MVHLLNRLFDDLDGRGKFLILLNEKARTFPANIHNIGKKSLYTLKMLTGNVSGKIIGRFFFIFLHEYFINIYSEHILITISPFGML